jgi:mono/diheme cytochrome c family protein
MSIRQRYLVMTAFFGACALALGLGMTFAQPTRSVGAATPPATASTGDPARGQYLVEAAACATCHSGAKGEYTGGVEFKLGPLGTFYSANLTVLQTWTTDDFLKVFHEGVDPKNGRVLAPVMPYMAFHGMSDDDVASVGAYLKTLKPIQNDVPQAQPGAVAVFALKALPPVSVPPWKPDTTATYGDYLVNHVSACGDCHTPRDAQTQQPIEGKDLAGGGINLGTDQQPLYATPILGSVLTAEGYTAESFEVALRTGVRPWGARIPVQMPWQHYANLTHNDILAIWNYLQTKKLDAPWPVGAVPTAASVLPPTSTPVSTQSR